MSYLLACDFTQGCECPGETVVALVQIRWDVKQKMTYQWFPLPGKAHAVKVRFEQAIAPVLQRVTNIDDDAAGLGGAVIPFVYLLISKSLPISPDQRRATSAAS